ncbi:UDP-N-acetylglucosamine 1-carboxyvinyltransferase [Candidatus Saccharibacteria bacterium]|nr:UDP-N-acetylglucosamine 1-carboxyvinyltransferase [Candidatus Saccharibacteria bacterium]MCB9834838.1 UDP-N-acetylglucosamine 1-carboxyvinyltransferase [Candidatus Nomurabacteria bacterium]
MSKMIINGPAKLAGTWEISGNKNAALPILIATVLLKTPVTISNIPDIIDIQTIKVILESLGSKIEVLSRNSWKIDNSQLNNQAIPTILTASLRASNMLIGPLIARFGEAQMGYPGGDNIGARPMDAFYKILDAFGIEYQTDGEKLEASIGIEPNSNSKREVSIIERSVTASEMGIMLASITPGKTKYQLVATEPHVVDLVNFLVKAGADIKWVDNTSLMIIGVDQLEIEEWKIIPDQLETGTAAIAAIATKSELRIIKAEASHHHAMMLYFDQMGVNYYWENQSTLIIYPSQPLAPLEIKTAAYPLFPSDLQAPMAVLLTQANGTSTIFETIFEGRLNYFHQLSQMGANLVIKETHVGLISGPTPLYGGRVFSLDIRAGATLIIAALIAEGQTVIEDSQHIDRGYQDIQEKLSNLGVEIWRED